MQLLLAFMPFIVFAVSISELGSVAALLLGALASAILVGHGLLSGRSAKLLEVGSLVLFGALAGFEYLSGARLSLIGAKFAVDLGLFLIVVLSILIGLPFTLQYAKESVAPELWSSPEFKRKNDVISMVWAGAFLVMVLAELAMLAWPALPHRMPVFVIVVALVGAFKFTQSQRGARGSDSVQQS
ncbi:hypothetical protein [Bosea sp. BH3]|uniref:hypothetical protein n=1 Tax=Bosea sp. BH3 TaxID=2871701 RepID=UPI0021CB408B|nr:hypothetical protein [Bosea sp. BH3]MCU4179097.1 hypothetical protein [Bosea sp. BH3]